jgi:CRISPR/Cas system-associated endonuclease Cas1
MPVLYVTQPGASVRQKGARLRVEWQGQVLAALPVREIERLVLLGPVQLSASATRLLLRAGIPVLFGSVRGRCYGTLRSGTRIPSCCSCKWRVIRIQRIV